MADPAGFDDELAQRVERWIGDDPDAQTRRELDTLLNAARDGDAAAAADLHDRFSGRLAFGTAGLRAELGGGPMRMNRVVVAQAAAGLAAFLGAHRVTRTSRTVVIGYDARHNSDVFARDSAEIFAGAGLDAVILPRALPTPVLAFTVKRLGAIAGVMVTASHNPPRDNGYKVYLGGDDGGSQIVAPADALIAADIERIAAELSVTDLPRRTDYAVASDDIVDAYVTATASVAPARDAAQGIVWAYTPLHGVGADTVTRVVSEAGYPKPHIVAEQRKPDADFPTVDFPNPEEKGALDLAFATAEDAGADLILANDPDADRLAVAVRGEAGWTQLSGNQVGLLLGWRAARTATPGAGASLASSLVSSPGLAALAQEYGLDYHATLTGFKWISRAPGLVFGYEEALGYLVNPHTVRDKDGISALVALLDLVAEARERGASLGEVWEEFCDTFGHFTSGQVSLRVADLAVIETAMGALRADPPTHIGTAEVARFEDLLETDDGSAGSNIIRIALTDGSRVIARPSGTEPKLKVYLDVRGDTADEASERVAALDTAVRELLERVTG